MPIFNEEGTLPLSRFDIAPDYEKSPLRRAILGLTGYNANGTSNNWGRWLDVTGGGIVRNLASRSITSGDTKKNIKDDFATSLAGLQLWVGAAQTALGMVGPTSGAATSADPAAATASSAATGSATSTPKLSPKLQDGSFDPNAILDGDPSNNSVNSNGTNKGASGSASVGTSKPKTKFSMNGIENIIGGATGLFAGNSTDLTSDDRKYAFMKYMKCGGKLKMEHGGKLYEDDDKTEDVNIIDKKTGQKVAEMRYGERIFSQKASIVMEELADMGEMQTLGQYVAKEIREQERICDDCGMQERDCECEDKTEKGMLGMNLEMKSGGKMKMLRRFASGGKFGGPNDPKPMLVGGKDYMRLPEYVYSLNEKQLESLLKDIPNSSRYMKNGKPDKVAIDAAVSDGKGGPVTEAVYAAFKRMNPAGASKLPYAGATEPGSIPLLKTEAPSIDANAARAKAVEQSDSPMSATDILNDSYNVFGALVSGIQGSKGLPSWQIPQSYMQNLNRLKQRSEIGLTDLEKSYGSDMIAKNYAKDVATINSMVGGGGSSGAALAATRSASESAQNAGTRLFLADVQARDAGSAAYTAELGRSVNLDRTLFEDQYQVAAARDAAASSTLTANLKAINDRRDYNKTYGQGSAYERLNNAIIGNMELNNQAMREKLNTKSSASPIDMLSENDKKTLR